MRTQRNMKRDFHSSMLFLLLEHTLTLQQCQQRGLCMLAIAAPFALYACPAPLQEPRGDSLHCTDASGGCVRNDPQMVCVQTLVILGDAADC